MLADGVGSAEGKDEDLEAAEDPEEVMDGVAEGVRDSAMDGPECPTSGVKRGDKQEGGVAVGAATAGDGC